MSGSLTILYVTNVGNFKGEVSTMAHGQYTLRRPRC